MQINPFSISLAIIQAFCSGLGAKQIHKKGGECHRLLAGERREMTPLMGHKDLFMVLV